MQIDYIVCPETIEEKLGKKHHVTMREVRQALLNNPRLRFAEKGYTEGDIAKICGGNLLRVWSEVDVVARSLQQTEG